MFSTFNKKLVLIFVVALPLCGMWQIGNGTYIHAKAILAQVLLETAWAETLKGQKEVKPWPWADTWPISRLNVPSLGISRIVLAGASGSSLAFGPGHLFGTTPPGQSGNSVIAGHRDTHFRFLQDLHPDDIITVQTTHNTKLHYRIIETAIIDETDIQYLTETHDRTLTLITCFPFDAIVPGGPLRYVVVAKQTTADSALSI
jgi:sortase A